MAVGIFFILFISSTIILQTKNDIGYVITPMNPYTFIPINPSTDVITLYIHDLSGRVTNEFCSIKLQDNTKYVVLKEMHDRQRGTYYSLDEGMTPNVENVTSFQLFVTMNETGVKTKMCSQKGLSLRAKFLIALCVFIGVSCIIGVIVMYFKNKRDAKSKKYGI